MRLKRVKIFGFKTFADRTEFDLHGNMVAVVGPNGCGKSNLVDAILWGLGEGNARHLRAQNNQDVIFSGSARRKPVGFAEVSLLFDNEDGALPIQSSEVSVTRRLSRSGESDYYINRQACRLRDVLDLLADSGLGRAGYAIVSQKEIDQALSASAEERRAWVDEAAGVQRYRVRKNESLKRLSSARDHLNRVTDIIQEIEGQQEPLRAEAEVAIRYKSVLSSLREVESGLMIVEVARASREVLELEARISEIMSLVKAELGSADRAEAEARSASEEVRRLEAELDRVRDSRQSSISALERAAAAIRLGEQKLGTLKDLEENLGEEAEATKVRILEAEVELASLEAELIADREKLASTREECSGAGEEAKTLREGLRSVEKELATGRDLHNRKLRQEAERAQIGERSKAVKREIAGIDASIPGLKSALDDAARAHGELQSLLNQSEAEIAALSKSMADLDRQESQEAQENRKRLSDRASLEGRRQGIEGTIHAHEGLTQGARAVLDACTKGVLHARYVPIGEALEVKKEHALAIETALGGAVNDLIVEEEAHAKQAIEHLKVNRLGRATFQPLPLMRTYEPGSDLKRLLNQPGVVARASELVGCSVAHRPVFESLLGRVLVVQSLDTALRLAKTTGWNRLVTLEGEVVHSSGAVSGGVSGRATYGLVQRKADLSQVVSEVKKLNKLIEASEARINEFVDQRNGLAGRLQELRSALEARQGEVKESREWLHNVQSEFTGTERSRLKLEHELNSLLSHHFEPVEEVDLAGLELKRDQLLAILAARTADAESAAERLREVESRARQAETRVEIAQKRLLGARENDRLRERKLTNLGPEREKTLQEIAQARQELDRAEKVRAQAEADLKSFQAQRGDLLAELDRQGEMARKARSHAQTCSDSAHQAELSRARIETRRAASVQRLLEEYGITEDEALIREVDVVLPTDASTIVNRLRRELRAMGDVNIGAVEAYERLNERWDELTNQREDIEGGICQVEASIRELDKLTRERFSTTFEEVRKAFASIFARLFAGGEGRIFLTDEHNLLETGVEIDVMLPGKKRQQLELLSGGERSLCAASFLFALLQVKPSPLVILDEVDAPLDGRNVERFIELLKDFMSVSQFILITHNPTTIESAPVWLGVTMQEPGVSTLVPARFAPAEAAVPTETAPDFAVLQPVSE